MNEPLPPQRKVEGRRAFAASRSNGMLCHMPTLLNPEDVILTVSFDDKISTK